MKFCLACGGSNLETVLDLGEQSNVNRLTIDLADDIPTYPLGVDACRTCGHGQLTHHVDPSELFSDYLYSSSTSQTLRDYSSRFAAALAIVKPKARVLEIASNDGILLRELVSNGLSAIGVEPASRMAQKAISEGLDVIQEFWPTLVPGKFEVVVGQNVFAHTPDPRTFLSTVGEVLSDDGIAFFQTSQADMVANGEFDTVYHEHYSFFSESSARALAERCGLRLLGTLYTNIHGNSSVYVFSKASGAEAVTFDEIERAFRFQGILLEQPVEDEIERLRATRDVADWKSFAELAKDRMRKVETIVFEARAAGRSVIAVGAAAKGLTFLKAAKIRPDLIWDEAPDKVQKWSHGLEAQILPFGACASANSPLFVITAWNFRDELVRKIRALKHWDNAEYLVYFPDVKLAQLS